MLELDPPILPQFSLRRSQAIFRKCFYIFFWLIFLSLVTHHALDFDEGDKHCLELPMYFFCPWTFSKWLPLDSRIVHNYPRLICIYFSSRWSAGFLSVHLPKFWTTLLNRLRTIFHVWYFFYVFVDFWWAWSAWAFTIFDGVTVSKIIFMLL